MLVMPERETRRRQRSQRTSRSGWWPSHRSAGRHTHIPYKCTLTPSHPHCLSRELRESNAALKMEADQLRSETADIEAKERELVQQCLEQFSEWVWSVGVVSLSQAMCV